MDALSFHYLFYTSGCDFGVPCGVYSVRKTFMDLSNSELVDLVLHGEKDAFAELVRRHQDAVYNLAYRMAGNHADAAELAHEAFVKAFQKLALYNKNYAFGNWVMSICANLAKNLFRSRDRRKRAEEASLDLVTSTPPSSEVQMDDALHQLPETLRIPVVLKHMEDLSYEEIGQVLRIGVSAAKMRVKRGIEQLAGILRAERKEPDYETA